MRAFFSIPVPAEVGAALLGLVPPIRGVRRGQPGQLHLTLHFLADAPDDLADRVRLEGLPPAFRITPGRLVLLPTSGPVRVIAASARGEGLAATHEVVARGLLDVGLPVESRPFLPHITLARCQPPLPQQVRQQTPMAPRSDLSFPVTGIELVESRLGEGEGGSPLYRLIRRWALPTG